MISVKSVLLIMLGTLQLVWAKDNVYQIKKTIPLQNETSLEVHITFAAGKLFIEPGEPTELFSSELTFSDQEPNIDYSINSNTGILELSTADTRNKDEEEKNYKINNWDDLKKNVWHLRFSREIPIRFHIEIGAAENTFDFGGLQIKELVIETGATETQFNFSKPNPIVMSKLEINAGVSKIKGRHLLNANFKKFLFEGGVGDYDFYFTGKLKRTSRVDVESGVATTRLVLSPETAFKLNMSSSIFSSVDIENADEEDEDYWISDNFKKGNPYLNISADAGVGSFKIEYSRH